MSDKIKQEVTRILVVLGANRLSHSFMFAVYSVFLLSRGLDLFEIAMINLVYHLTIPFLEIPTGAFADAIGRKKSYLIANALEVAGFLLYATASSFWGFAFAEFVLAVGFTFASGCTDAHIWETVVVHAESEGLDEGASKDLNRTATLAKDVVIRTMGAIGGAIGPFIAAYGVSLPWFASAIGVTITATLAYRFLREEKVVSRQVASVSTILNTSREAIRLIFSSEELKRQVTIAFFAGFGLMPIFMYWAPRLKGLASANGWAGLSFGWVLIEGAVLLGAVLARKAAKRYRDETIILTGTTMIGAAVLVLASSNTYVTALAALLVVELFNSFSATGQMMMKQSEISFIENGEDTVRATILSAISMASEVGVVLSLVLCGLVSRAFSIPAAWTIAGAAMLLSAMLQYIWRRSQ